VSYAVFPSSRGDHAPRLTKNEDKETLRQQVAEDIRAYLDGGGTITYCPAGESAMDMAQTYTPKKTALDISGSTKSRNLTY
jgi:hypothetical protein